MLHVGDITKLNGNELPPVDIITGGSPCQDLSVAGARAGLAGERSGLFMEQVRIVKEMRDADERRGRAAHAVRPRYMVWENVPGAFSSAGGEDFRVVLEEIVRIKACTGAVPRPDSGRWEFAGAIILGDQFSLAWRVMDAQYWGVAQRRKRIFLVADFAGRSAPQILFEQDRLFGNPAQSQGERQGTSATAQKSIRDSSGSCTVGFDGYNGDMTGDKAATLGVNCGMSTGRNGIIRALAANQRDEVRDMHDVAAALGAQPGIKQQTFVAGIVSKGNGDCFLTPDCHTALTAGGGQAGQGYPCIFAAGFSAGQGAEAGGIGYQTECAPTLKASESGSNIVAILSPIIILLVLLCSLLSGTADHNTTALELCFHGGVISDSVPEDYRGHIENMRDSFSILEGSATELDGQMEDGDSLDQTRVKAVFYALYFGEKQPSQRAHQQYLDCFITYEERTRTVTEVDDAGNEVEVEETYTVAVPIRDLSVVYENIRSKMGTEITAEDQANATEIYYRILCGGPAPTYGSEFDIWSDGLPLSDAPFIGADGFCSPIGESWRSVVTSEFGWRKDPFTGKGAGHTGIDLGMPKGTPIRAALTGTVYLVRYSTTGYGYHVMIDHGGGFVTLYAHCSKLLVAEGQQVQAGDIIAEVGSTGRSTGNHLHFEVRINGEKQNPRSYLP